MLAVFDKLFILSLHDEKCTVFPSAKKKLEFGLSGAILAELTLCGKVRVGPSSKLEVVDASEIGDGILDEAVNLFQRFEKRNKVSYFIKSLVEGTGARRKRLMERLVSGGVLNQGEERLSWVIPYADSSSQNASAKFVLKSCLRELVLTSGEPELSDLALLDLAKACRLLNFIFTKDERKTAQRWIYNSITSKALVDPVAQTLQEIDESVDSLTANL